MASHPVRDAWIEIICESLRSRFLNVASREGCVD